MQQLKPNPILRKPIDLTNPRHPHQRLRWAAMRRRPRGPSATLEVALPWDESIGGRDAFLQTVVEACASSLVVLDETGAILFSSKSWCSSAPRDRDGSGQGLSLLTSFRREHRSSSVSSRASLVLRDDIGEILRCTLSEFHREYYCLDDGAKRIFDVHVVRLNLSEPDRFRVLLSIEELTKEREAEKRLRDLGRHLISIQEEERSRVALELHDDLSQRLALLSLELDQASRRIPEIQKDFRMSIQGVRASVDDIFNTVQRVAYQLHPAKLDQLGLSASVTSLCEEISRIHEIKITFRDRGCLSCLAKEVTHCLYRIAQESLRNVIKHSGSRKATVVLSAKGGVVSLSVSDSGRGFDLHSAQAKSGLGLTGMTERLRLVGGEISIVSNDRGTRIRVSMPTSGEQPKPKSLQYKLSPVLTGYNVRQC